MTNQAAPTRPPHAGAPHAAQHLSHCAVLAVEARQLRHGKAALTIAARGEAIDRQEKSSQLVERTGEDGGPLPAGGGIGGSHWKEHKEQAGRSIAARASVACIYTSSTSRLASARISAPTRASAPSRPCASCASSGRPGSAATDASRALNTSLSLSTFTASGDQGNDPPGPSL